MRKCFNKIELLLITILFFLHLFLLERYRDNFLEVDVHVILFVTGIIVLLKLIVSWNENQILAFSLDKISIIGFSLVFLITIQAFFNDLISPHYIWLTWAWYIIFTVFKNQILEIDLLIKSFVISVLAVLIFELFDISFINRRQLLGGQINTGENANYIVSTIPFLLSVSFYFYHKTGLLAVIFRYISIVGFLVGLYLIVINNARTAYFGVGIGLAFILGSKFQFTKIFQMAQKTILSKIVFCAILILLVTLGTYKTYIINSDSVKGRLLIYKVSSSIFSSHYQFGIGIQRFKDVYNNYQSEFISYNRPPLSQQLLADDTFFAFNEFLQIGIELGLVGLSLILFLLVLIFNIKTQNILMIGAKATIISTIVCCLFSYPLRSTSVLINIIFYISILVTNSDRREYTFSINYKILQLLSLFMFVGCNYVLFTEYQRIHALNLWKQAAYLAQEDQFIEAKPLYEECYFNLKKNGNFLFNYGSEQFIAGETLQSIFLLEAASLRISHSNLFIYMGNNYNSLHKYENAEECYLKAINMVPSRFLPKYLLFLMYKNQGQTNKALAVANEILTFPVKFQSSKIDEYKKNSKDYINRYPNVVY